MDVDDPAKHIVKVLYSAFYFAVTFILLNYLGYLAQAINAWYLDYNPVFNYNGVEELYNGGWSTKRIAFVFLAAPLIGLFTSLIAFYWYLGVDHKRSHLQQFYFWLSLNGFMLFFSYLVTGTLAVGDYNSRFFTGFVAVFTWLEWKETVIYVVLLVLAMLFVFYGRRYSMPILKSSYSIQLLKRSNGRGIVFLNSVVFPYLIGSLMVFAVTYPHDLVYFAIRVCCYVIVFLIMYWGISNRSRKVGKVKKGGLKYASPIWLVLLFLILFAGGRYFLGWEISL